MQNAVSVTRHATFVATLNATHGPTPEPVVTSLAHNYIQAMTSIEYSNDGGNADVEDNPEGFRSAYGRRATEIGRSKKTPHRKTRTGKPETVARAHQTQNRSHGSANTLVSHYV